LSGLYGFRVSGPTPPKPGEKRVSTLKNDSELSKMSLGVRDAWAQLPLGNPSQRRTAYRPQQRVAAVLAGLAAGLTGIAPGNTWLRPNSALVALLGGRFPDQGTIHRWLDQATAEQAAHFRDHLHQV